MKVSDVGGSPTNVEVRMTIEYKINKICNIVIQHNEPELFIMLIKEVTAISYTKC